MKVCFGGKAPAAGQAGDILGVAQRARRVLYSAPALRQRWVLAQYLALLPRSAHGRLDLFPRNDAARRQQTDGGLIAMDNIIALQQQVRNQKRHWPKSSSGLTLVMQSSTRGGKRLFMNSGSTLR
jgi:hypothetical protein